MDIVFNKTVYQEAGFYRYELTQERKGSAPKTDQEKAKQKIDDVLCEQLDKVIFALKESGVALGNANIIGDDLEDDVIHIEMYRQEASITGKGKRQTGFNLYTVMPDRPYILKKAAETFPRMLLEHMRKENAIEVAKKNHTPNWVSAGELFTAISDALSEESENTITVGKLIDRAYMTSDWPLHMRSRLQTDLGEPMTSDTQIDCAEFIVFQLNQGGSWDLKAVDGLKSAQLAITKQGFHYKQTEAVIVLKDLKQVPYTLFAESDDGLIAVTPSEAYTHKKLHVSWKKAK